MPVSVTKTSGGKYRVTTKKNGRTNVHAKATSKKKASSQERILNMAEHGIPIPESWGKKKK